MLKYLNWGGMEGRGELSYDKNSTHGETPAINVQVSCGFLVAACPVIWYDASVSGRFSFPVDTA